MTMTTISIGKYGFVTPEQLSPELSAVYSPLMTAHIDDLTAALDHLETRVQSIGKDSRLTHEGKIHAIRQSAERAFEQIDKAADRHKKLAQDINRAGGPTRLPNCQELAREYGLPVEVMDAQLREIRLALAEMDPLEQRESLNEAAVNKNTRRLVAALGFDPLVSPVDRQDLRKAIDLWLERNTPEAAQLAGEALIHFKGNHAQATQHVTRMTNHHYLDDVDRWLARNPTPAPAKFPEGKEADTDRLLP